MRIPGWLANASPLMKKMADYRREEFTADLIASVIVTIMLVPQAMAYAMLAGLPPQIGLYASILPLILYSLFGTSNTLAVGPVAMVSLMVVSGVGELAEAGSVQFVGYCLTLALLVGLIQIAMALFRLGFLVNFISHPVLVGFTSAAAIVIGSSQMKHIFGINIPKTEYPFEMIWATILATPKFNSTTLGVGLGSISLLLFFRFVLGPLLQRLNVGELIADNLAKLGPLITVAISSIVVGAYALHQSAAIDIVGEIPAGLPRFTLPPVNVELVRELLPLAVVITLVGYLESISVAKALASRRREKLDTNRELFALGMADIGSALTGGYPVTGGFSRSLVNFSAGAQTPVSGLIVAAWVGVSVVLLTPAFFYIPKAVLAAIIIVAVSGLIDFQTPIKLWRYSRTDAVASIVTFVAVLGQGIEEGILSGVAVTIVMMMWKTSQPHIAEVGRMEDGLGFRNVDRHTVATSPNVLIFRVDESLSFANAPRLESYVFEKISERADIKNILLICSGINDIDATGLESLRLLQVELEEVGIGLFLSDVKGPVTDRLKLAGCEKEFLEQHIFLTAEQAIAGLVGIQN